MNNFEKIAFMPGEFKSIYSMPHDHNLDNICAFKNFNNCLYNTIFILLCVYIFPAEAVKHTPPTHTPTHTHPTHPHVNLQMLV